MAPLTLPRFPSPATSNRACSSPAHGLPTIFFPQRSRTTTWFTRQVKSFYAAKVVIPVFELFPRQPVTISTLFLHKLKHTSRKIIIHVLKFSCGIARLEEIPPPSYYGIEHIHNHFRGQSKHASFG
jgi:hypothetical protein